MGSKIKRTGKTRVKNKFLLFPKKIGNEWRWLKNSSYKEEKIITSYGGPGTLNPITFNENPKIECETWEPLYWI